MENNINEVFSMKQLKKYLEKKSMQRSKYRKEFYRENGNKEKRRKQEVGGYQDLKRKFVSAKSLDELR